MSSSSSTTSKPPWQWIPEFIIFSVATIIATMILRRELQTRQSPTTAFTTKSLKIFSLSCIVSAWIECINVSLSYFQPFCYVYTYIYNVSLHFGVFMGFYQLSRLYYCSARTQVHTVKGYATWVFVLMAVIGAAISVLLTIVLPFVAASYDYLMPQKCGIRGDGTESFHSFVETVSGRDRDRNSYLIFLCITFALYLAWDILTLLLYICKVRSITNKFKIENQQIYQRIMSILLRVLIPTIFYQVASAVAVALMVINAFALQRHFIFGYFLAVCQAPVPVLFAYAMYIMLEHNTKEYVRFLKFVHVSRLHYCCCKWGAMIEEQLVELTGIEACNELQSGQVETETHAKTTVEETQTATVYQHAYGIANVELSVDTELQDF